MRTLMLCYAVALTLSAAACQDISAPQLADDTGPAFVLTADQQTGPTNVCYGEIIKGIASTWPWAHDDKVAFEPPPGAIALWLKIFGPGLGISSVRELQDLFCTST